MSDDRRIKFLRELIKKSESKNKRTKLKLVNIENRLSPVEMIELSKLEIETFSVQTLNSEINYNSKLFIINGDGTIEFEPNIIMIYLQSIERV